MRYKRSPQPELFKNARKVLKCSQARLARLLGIHPSTISRIEKGTQCPDIRLIEGVERLTKKSAEALVAKAYRCENTLQELPDDTAALPVGHRDYEYLRYHHQDALDKLNKRLRYKERELATVKRCLAIDRTTLGALAIEIDHCQDIVDFLTEKTGDPKHAITFLQQYQDAHHQKDQMALRWLQGFTMVMEDEIRLLKQEIASREVLLEAAEAQAAVLLEAKRAEVKADKARKAMAQPPVEPTAPEVGTTSSPQAPPEPKILVTPVAPRLEIAFKPLFDTALGRKLLQGGRAA